MKSQPMSRVILAVTLAISLLGSVLAGSARAQDKPATPESPAGTSAAQDNTWAIRPYEEPGLFGTVWRIIKYPLPTHWGTSSIEGQRFWGGVKNAIEEIPKFGTDVVRLGWNLTVGPGGDIELDSMLGRSQQAEIRAGESPTDVALTYAPQLVLRTNPITGPGFLAYDTTTALMEGDLEKLGGTVPGWVAIGAFARGARGVDVRSVFGRSSTGPQVAWRSIQEYSSWEEFVAASQDVAVVRAPAGVRFLQPSFGSRFSQQGSWRSASVGEVSGMLERNGATLVVDVIRDAEGNWYIVNTRSYAAAVRSGNKPFFRDVTGLHEENVAWDAWLKSRLEETWGQSWPGARQRVGAGGLPKASAAPKSPAAPTAPDVLRVRGVGEVLKEAQLGTRNQVQGAVYQLRSVVREVEQGPGIRYVEDHVRGLGPKAHAGQKGADLIRVTGDVVQYKSYSDLGNVISEIRGSTSRRGQAYLDFARYSKNGWRDGGGGTLSGRFEYRIDGQRLLDEGYTRAAIERACAQLEAELNQNLGGFDVGNGSKTVFKVIPDFEAAPTPKPATVPGPVQPTGGASTHGRTWTDVAIDEALLEVDGAPPTWNIVEAGRNPVQLAESAAVRATEMGDFREQGDPRKDLLNGNAIRLPPASDISDISGGGGLPRGPAPNGGLEPAKAPQGLSTAVQKIPPCGGGGCYWPDPRHPR